MDQTHEFKAKRTDTRSAKCACRGDGDDGDAPIVADFEKMGRTRFLQEVQAAARDALAALPSGDALRKFNKPGRAVVARMAELYAGAASAERWSDADIGNFAREMGWVKVVMDLEMTARINNGRGPGAYDTNCNKVYDDCMTESGCTYSFFCICCIPCSAKYSRCVLGLPVAGGGGIFIA